MNHFTISQNALLGNIEKTPYKTNEKEQLRSQHFLANLLHPILSLPFQQLNSVGLIVSVYVVKGIL
jgi:hypothetical protein